MEKKRFSVEDLEKAKKVNLREYLGLKQGQNIISPFRTEKNPSFSIYRNQKNDHWEGKDHGGRTEPYDAISIVMALEKVNFVTATKSLLAHEENNKQNQNQNIAHARAQEKEQATAQEKEKSKYEWLTDITEGLEYLENQRKIAPEIIEKIKGKIRVVDWHNYSTKYDKTFVNRLVVFSNQSGGWIGRNINPNSKIPEHKPKGVSDGLSILKDDKYGHVYVFESCIDALSYMSLHPYQCGTFVSLNGVNNYQKLKELDSNRSFNLVLDTDKTGWDTVRKIQKMFPDRLIFTNTMDIMQVFGIKDMNDVLKFDASEWTTEDVRIALLRLAENPEKEDEDERKAYARLGKIAKKVAAMFPILAEKVEDATIAITENYENYEKLINPKDCLSKSNNKLKQSL